MTLSLVEQYLFSYFNLTKVSSFKSALVAFEEIINKLEINETVTPERLIEKMLEINKVIKKYDLEIVEMVDEISCEKMCILINTADNVITQKSKFYEESITQLFSKIVKDCVLSEEGHLSETYCLNLSSQVKMTKSGAQSALEKLITDKWLVSMNDRISLGTRTIAELEQNIKQQYPDDVKNCYFCKLIVIQGYICCNCKVKCHYACCKKYFRLSESNQVCPSCKEIWNDVPSHINTEISHQPEADSTFITGPPKKKKRKSCISDII